MGYKWKPSKAQRRAFAERMKDPVEREAYEARKAEKERKRREKSKFNYSTAGGDYVATEHQNGVAFSALSGEYGTLTKDQENACNMVISAYSIGEKTHHDNIHIVNELFRSRPNGYK